MLIYILPTSGMDPKVGGGGGCLMTHDQWQAEGTGGCGALCGSFCH